MLGLEKELYIFVHAVMSGMVVYGVYTIIRIVRRLVKHNLLSISIEDFLFWVGTSFYLFMQIYNTSSGSVRWYLILGIAAGMILLSLALFLTKKMFGKIKKRVDKSDKTR